MTGVAVVVVHWNEPDRCAGTVRALRGQASDCPAVVVDNASTPAAVAALRRQLPADVRLLELATNTGYGPGANRGIEAALADPAVDVVVLAPHDAVPGVDCVPKLCATLRDRPSAGAVSAEYGPGRGLEERFDWVRGMHLVPAPDHPPGWQSVLYPHGTLMAVRRLCWAAVGGFDERYFAYSEEHDWGLRARRSGWEVGVVGGAVVGNPIRSAGTAVTSYLNLRNSLLVVRDHAGRIAAVVRTAVILANTLGVFVRPGRAFSAHPWPRLRAVADFWRGRFGPPPVGL